MSFGSNLRSELLYNDIQIKEFAGKINIPYVTMLSYLNKKSRIPRADIALKIASELGLSVESLFGLNVKENEIRRNLYNDIGLLPLEIQKSILLLVKGLLQLLCEQNK